jgi:hypothetical protein
VATGTGTKAKAELTPGWLCDGRGCTAVESDLPGLGTRASLDRAGWLVRHVHGVVVRAYCPRCRRGILNNK